MSFLCASERSVSSLKTPLTAWKFSCLEVQAVLQNAIKLMDPHEWPADEESLAAFGNDHVRNLTDHSVVISDSNGVQEDNRSDEIDCQLIALGLFFYRVTGPYWELLGRDVHYLDFCTHVMRMHDFLQKWADNAVDVFADQFKPLFGTKFMPNAPIFRAMLSSQRETKEEVKWILKKLCKGCLETTKRQLADFLPEGKYHGVQDEDMRKRLQHSKLTNLIGEQAFGDLDFSVMHHCSTINMLKRNKSISTFLNLKTPEEQHSLLQLSRQKAEALRKKHRQDEKDAVARRQLILEETHAAPRRSRQKITEGKKSCSSPPN